MIQQDPREPLEFSCFDDFDNNGWVGSSWPEPREDEDEFIDLENDNA